MRFSSLLAAICSTMLMLPMVANRALAQSSQALPGCEPSTQISGILAEKLKAIREMPLSARLPALEELVAKYPRELEPSRQLADFGRFFDHDQISAIQERFRQEALVHPDDPFALFLAGRALWHKDTQESIRMLEKAKTIAPTFPWAPLALADILSEGKHEDKKSAYENLAAFFSTCRGDTGPWWAQALLNKVGDTALQGKVAGSLRTRLSSETDPSRLKDYGYLWGLEFRIHPPLEHEALRKQMGQDLKRIESLNPTPDSQWLAFLLSGYKQSGASEETITRMEDRLVREYPHSNEAYEIVSQRWRKAHKDPKDSNDADAWAKYRQANRAALQGFIHDFPDETVLARYVWFYTVRDDDSVPLNDRVAALETFLDAIEKYDSPSSSTGNYLMAGQFLLKHNLQPERALRMLEAAQTVLSKEMVRTSQDDDLSTEELHDRRNGELVLAASVAGLRARAAKLAGQPQEAAAIQTLIDIPLPEKKAERVQYWWNRARLADLESHRADALAYYQLALYARSEPPPKWQGKIEDDLGEEARVLWKELGGTDTAWKAWSTPPAGKPEELAAGRWERPKKELSPFDLSDFTGKTWRLKELAGKTLLINLWATWCAPCQRELPHLQKLYENVRNRSDLQILTFNVDEEVGLVAPYLKEKGYTFPVLSAFNYVNGNGLGGAVPQNWIFDQKGVWQWDQLGYAGDANWEDDMIKRLESTKAAP